MTAGVHAPSSGEITRRIEELGPWFYSFDLGGGLRTPSSLAEPLQAVFYTRQAMVEAVVDAHFSGRFHEARCVDIGCHEGFYSVAMARKGFREVLGLDVRADNLAKARFVTSTIGFPNTRFDFCDCEQLTPEQFGEFELCLFLGVVYHLENPMLALRNAYAVTREVCLIESQVVDEVEGATEYGSREWTRAYKGVIALLDEHAVFGAPAPDDADAAATPAFGHSTRGAARVGMCPSRNALVFMLRAAGFRRVDVLPAPEGAYEQFARGKRIICAAYK